MQQDFADRWNVLLSTLAQWRKLHPDHAPQILRFQRNVEKLRLESQKHLCEHRRSHRPSHLHRAEKLINQAEQELKLLSRLEFLATLSK